MRYSKRRARYNNDMIRRLRRDMVVEKYAALNALRRMREKRENHGSDKASGQ